MNCSNQAVGSVSGGGAGGGKKKRNRKRTSLKSGTQEENVSSACEISASVAVTAESQSYTDKAIYKEMSKQSELVNAATGASITVKCVNNLSGIDKKSDHASGTKETLARAISQVTVEPATVQCGSFETVESLSIGKDKADCIISPAHVKSCSSNSFNKSDNISVNIVKCLDAKSMSSCDGRQTSSPNVNTPKNAQSDDTNRKVKANNDKKLVEKNEKPGDGSAHSLAIDKSVSKANGSPTTTAAAIDKQAAADKAAAGAGEGATAQKSKAELSRERRALQEAQRALKAARNAEGGGSTTKQGKDPSKQTTPQGSEQSSKRQDNKKVKSTDVVSKPSTVESAKCTPDKKAEKDKKIECAASLLLARETKVRVPDQLQQDNQRTVKRIAKKLERQNVPIRATEKLRKIGLFQHLRQYERDVPLTRDILLNSTNLHPAIIKLGLQYAEGVICGSNARCVALLLAMKKVIADYSTSPNTELSRDLEARILRPTFSFLAQCRPLSVSMGNAIRHIKRHITLTPSDCSDAVAKQNLCDEIDSFLKEKIILAAEAISNFAGSKINTGDVILVYACSSLIKTVLCNAYQSKKFSVIVVDSRPKEEGREMLRRLVRHGIPCSYVLISSVSYVMKEVTQVLLGAHALLANGYMVSRVGSSQVALIAKAYNVPVIVCCETYKFSEKVWTDSFVANELGDPSDLVRTVDKSVGVLSDWISVPRLNLLNLVYDVTPPQLINMVITDITDFGLVPCTSVPVVLRIKSSETS